MSGKYIQDLIIAVNQVYRLVDAGLNGAQYSSSPNPVDPARPLVSPAIPAVPAADIGVAPGLRAQLLAAQGTIGGGWFGIGSRPATLADLADAMKGANDSDTTRVTDAINAIAGDSGLAQGSQAAVIFNTVKGLFMDGEELVTDGAVLGTLIATAIANAAMLGTMAGQIDRLIASLDGGGQAPADNVLTALRGTAPAGELRNVIDSGGIAIADLVDQVETLLTEIKTLLS
jgi:hypothetical protein